MIASLAIPMRASANPSEASVGLVEKQPKTDWYGLPIIVSDVLSVGGFAAGLAMAMPCFSIWGNKRDTTGCDLGGALAIASALSLGLTPAAIHMAHDNWVGTLGSLTARGSVVLFIALASGDAQAVVLLGTGAVAMVADWVIFARHEHKPRSHALGLRPTMLLSRDRIAFGLIGEL